MSRYFPKILFSEVEIHKFFNSQPIDDAPIARSPARDDPDRRRDTRVADPARETEMNVGLRTTTNHPDDANPVCEWINSPLRFFHWSTRVVLDIGTFHRPGSNTSHHFNTRRCKPPAKSQPTSSPTLHKRPFQSSGRQSHDRPGDCTSATSRSVSPKRKWWNSSTNKCISRVSPRPSAIPSWPAR